MKNVLIFIAGMITVVLIIAVIGLSKESKESNDIVWFSEKGECITKKPLRVFQTLEQSAALAKEKDSYDSTVVLLVNNEEKSYYDDQVISIPQKKCARQVGIYKYQTRDERWKTVPVVRIEE